MSENNRLKVLGDYLKSRRDRLQPEQAGIQSSFGRRRTPGLRREEVAILAGVSATYYTWLEQGREVTASREVIESIGRALQLSPDERLHLLRLWSPENSAVPRRQESVKPEWQSIIDQLAYPAFVANDRTEVLAWNRAACEIIADFPRLSDQERVLMRIFFMDPYFRKHMMNWEEFARYSVAVFRSYLERHNDDPWFKETAEHLAAKCSEFDSLWRLHDIQLKKESHFILNHPQASELAFVINSFVSMNADSDLHFCIYTPIAGTPTEQRLKKFLEAAF
ncbi:helix-turn-helix transcriptional regulator [Bacillus sp. 3255]|uniref:helix-turn-helix transcriptional regulator n=1 Tax=Bacillus sp. 3255 TaxID=2817904 RepID=UPI0028565AB4|nr:helix-turn-helix transcriptional regulator [Bacillus sp. 3255]MDR6879300.1 transcriptional regulator with XRE-family HTH domain [Bacillus sp. 3255]